MKVFYDDLIFRIIASVVCAHFVVMYGVEISFFVVLLKPMYWIAMGGSALIAFILVTAIRSVTIRLDKRYDWASRMTPRIFLQLTFGLFLPGVIAFLLAFIYFTVRGVDVFKTYYLRIDYPVILLLILLANAYYLVYYVIAKLKVVDGGNATDMLDTVSSTNGQVFLVNDGKQSIPVQVDQIAYFFREGDYNFLRTFEMEDYPIDRSLDEIEGYLPTTDFFRANRQFIIGRKAFQKFESLDYNKLGIFIQPEYKSQIIISQKRSRPFKDWIKLNG